MTTKIVLGDICRASLLDVMRRYGSCSEIKEDEVGDFNALASELTTEFQHATQSPRERDSQETGLFHARAEWEVCGLPLW